MKELSQLFVPYNIAGEASVHGFEETCAAYYWRNDMFYIAETQKGVNNASAEVKESIPAVLAPTWMQLMDWFREKHGIWIRVQLHNQGCHSYIERKEDRHLFRTVLHTDYYTALQEGIKEAFKLIKQ